MDDVNYWSRRWPRRTVLRGVGLAGAGLAGAALVGCGGDDDEPAATTEATAGSAGTGTGGETTANIKTGGRLALAQSSEPPEFDMHHSSTTGTCFVTSMCYNQLIRFDPEIGDENPEAVIGDLAESWEISPDGQTYTFHLQPGVKFHDGTPFTAADAKASYNRQIDPPETLINPPRSSQLQIIASMDTPDDQTLVMNMSRPVSSLSMLPILAQGWMTMYSQKDIEGGFDFKLNVNGTGPYLMTEYQQGAKVLHDKNPDYWVKDQPYLDGVDVFIVPDASTMLANFQGGQLHYYAPTLEALDQLQNTLGDKVTTGISNSIGYDCLNYGNREPWTDVRVRQAVSMAYDREAAVEILDFGHGMASGYMQRWGYWALSEEELHAIPGYEKYGPDTIAEARKLLDAAGVPATMDGTILVRQGFYEDLCLFMQDQLSRLGINVKLDIQETASAYDIMSKRDFDLTPWGHGMALDDPDAIFAEFYLPGSPRNYSQISSPEIEDAYLTQSQEQDPERRRELVRDLQQLAMALHGKSIFTTGEKRQTIWNYVKGFTPTHVSSYNAVRWQETWLDL